MAASPAPRPTPSSALAPATETAPAVKLRVLVAEDVQTNRQVLLQVLRRFGHEAHGVADGAAAVAEVAASRYDIVLMDIMMPEMDGVTAARAIRALPGPAALTPIIAITARVVGDIQRDCDAAGIDRIEARPINLSRLQAAIDAVLSERAALIPSQT